MLILPSPLLTRMHAHLEAGYPHEACGILIGDIDVASGRKTVKDVALVENRWADDAANDLRGRSDDESLANRFLISPEDMARADRDAGKRGLDIIGFFHSHPDHPSRPSETDRAFAWPVIAFVIVSVRAGQATTTQSWVLRDDREAFDEEEIHVEAP
jgi:proteasome lid subunit RPN8/RPN11